MGKEAQNTTPKYDKVPDIKDLLKLDDEDFIKNSYSAILKREADEEGLADYLSSLRDGSMDKIDIIEALRYSGEGKGKNVKIRGLRKFLVIREIYRVPLAGYLLKIIVNLIHLPRTLERIQTFQNDIYGRSNILGKELNEAAQTSNRRSDALGKELNEAAQTSKENIVKIKNDLETRIKSDLKTKVNNEVVKDIIDDLGDMTGQIKEHEHSITEQDTRFKRFLDDAKRSKEALDEKKHLHDAMYVAFEDKFRGTRKDIRLRVSIYLKYIKKVKAGTKGAPVIDVGCGRGEWLELLKENEYSAKGVDSNREMIKACRSRMLEVTESDAVAYLKGLKPESAGAITGFHIAEHIDFENMISLLDESLRVLKKGGILILETPNPENLIVGACNFYNDPTHISPIPPDTLQFMVNNRGFENIEVLRLHKHKHFEKALSSEKNKELVDLFAKEQDYSIIAYKK